MSKDQLNAMILDLEARWEEIPAQTSSYLDRTKNMLMEAKNCLIAYRDEEYPES